MGKECAYRLTVVKFETKKKQIKQTVSSKILPFLREEKSIDTKKKKKRYKNYYE